MILAPLAVAGTHNTIPSADRQCLAVRAELRSARRKTAAIPGRCMPARTTHCHRGGRLRTTHCHRGGWVRTTHCHRGGRAPSPVTQGHAYAHAHTPTVRRRRHRLQHASHSVGSHTQSHQSARLTRSQSAAHSLSVTAGSGRASRYSFGMLQRILHAIPTLQCSISLGDDLVPQGDVPPTRLCKMAQLPANYATFSIQIVKTLK